jgi:2-keto-4-pentenoate hydratase/2-oxohepta-3-ene-1,7-dioic acid hydratase in catechol pathway
MYLLRFAILGAMMLAALPAHAQAPAAPPFKLGTFERQGRPFVGIVLGESVVIDFAAAHAAIRTPASTVAAAVDMKDLIARYDQGLRARIVDIVRTVTTNAAARPPYVYDLTALKVLPPIMYPRTLLNVAVNYREHDIEMNTVGASGQTALGGMVTQVTGGAAPPGTRSAPGIWERAADDTRWNPYMFLKSPAAIVADGEAVRIPPNRPQIDWECELGVVIGRTAESVPVARAADYIFGYTLQNDVSDRGGRGDQRFGSDWLLMKSHATFAPLGPFITPREFIRDPKNMGVRFTLNGQVMQDANTRLMIHDVFDQVAYGSSILPLIAGDVIATGSPAGVGSARNPPIFLKNGDRMSCTYEGVGTLDNPVVGPSAAATR